MMRMEQNGKKELEKEKKKQQQTAAGNGYQEDQNDDEYGDYGDEGYGQEEYYGEQVPNGSGGGGF